MSLSDNFLLALEAYRDLQPELQSAGQTPAPLPQVPSLKDVVEGRDPWPRESILLGVAEDKLPILLDVYDPTPGPILVVGDGGTGKTAFLQSLACSTDVLHDPGDIQFAAITNFPEEWSRVEVLPGSLGVWPVYHQTARDFMVWLCSWADRPRHGRQAVLLFLDDLELTTNSNLEVQKCLRWFLTYGPEYRVWPLVTVNSARALQMKDWLAYFRTRIYGHVKNPALAAELTGDASLNLDGLFPGLQFVLQHPGGQMKFWKPGV